MRVHHLNCGTMRPPGGRLVDGTSGLLSRAEMVCHCLLVETDDGLVLVDTGVGSPATDNASRWLGAPFARLVKPAGDARETAVQHVERLGFQRSDVRHIVLTHLDLDHAGGLVDFPDATIHVYARELQALQSPVDAAERMRYRRIQFAHDPKWSPHSEAGEPWFGFTAVRELAGLPPEILLVPLAGHTRGHAGVAVDTGSGWLLHAGDAYYNPGQLDLARPHVPPLLGVFEKLMQTDRRARLDNQQRLRELQRDHGDQLRIFSAHNATELTAALTAAAV